LSLLRNFGTSAVFSARPALSAGLAIAFVVAAVLFALGWLPRSSPHEVSRGEAILMSVACAVIAAYFARCARIGWQRK
jgi:multisubunit Na+/H+ antiporter MnhB subunit